METGETDYYTDGSRAEVTYDTTGQSFESSANRFDPGQTRVPAKIVTCQRRNRRPEWHQFYGEAA